MEGLEKFVSSMEEMNASVSAAGQQGSQGSSVSSVGGRSSSRNGTLNASLFSQAAVSQRLVNLEYYMSPPVKEFDNLHSEFRNSAVKKVPVIRIFGTTPAGQKMCANIHGVYPYVSILDDDTVEGFEYRIAAALDNAINDSVSSTYGQKDGNFNKKGATQHVFKVIRMIGKTFYGYRSSSEVFVRIFFYNPLILRKAVDLLQSGSVLGRRFQPYEAHIPYSLQFMIDYCLYGMNYVHYSAVKFRRNSKDCTTKYSEDMRSSSQGSNSSVAGYIDPDCIDESLLGPTQLSKLTLCELEIDVLASDIILETKVSEKTMSVNPGIDSIWKDEIERRRLHGVDNCSQITIPESQERSQAPSIHPAEQKYTQILCQKLEAYFANNDESAVEGSQSLSFSNNSFMDDSELLPSSQVLDHLSGEGPPPKDAPVVDNQLSQEEDEFINLLEKMAEGPDSTNDQDIVENPFFENPETDESPDGSANDDEDIWDDSLLETSILEKISEAENTNADTEESHSNKNSSGPSMSIFQCDGQAGDSDSDEKSSSSKSKGAKEAVPTRFSRRMSEIKLKESATSSSKTVDSHNQAEKRRPGRPSKSHQDSPGTAASRLSLTLRRKSRSQETIKSKSQEDRTDRAQLKRKSVQRRSRSMSTDKVQEKEATTKEKGKAQGTSSKKPFDNKTASASRPVTRKSVSAQSTVEREKPNSAQTVTINKTNNSDTRKANTSNVNAILSKAQILKKEPVLCLKKVDADPTVSKNIPKRTRRKPRRFVEGEDGNTDSTNNKGEELESSHTEAKGDMSEQNNMKETEEQSTRKADKLKGGSEKITTSKKNEATNELVAGNSEELAKEMGQERVKTKGKLRRDKVTQRKEGEAVTEKDVEVTPAGKQKKHVQEKVIMTGIKQLGIVKKKKRVEVKEVASKSNEASNGHIDEEIKKSTEQDLSMITQEPSKVANASQQGESKAEHRDSQLKDSLEQTRSRSSTFVESKEDKDKSNIEMQVELVENDVSEPQKPSASSVDTILPAKKKRRGRPKTTKDTDDSNTSKSPIPPTKEKMNIPIAIVQENKSQDMSAETVHELSLKEDRIEEKLMKKAQVVDFGITCKPDNESTMSQADVRPVTRDVSIAATPSTKENSSQLGNMSTSSQTQTDTKEMVTVETQTDAIEPLCLCQCTCVTKQKAEVGVDNQDDLKPVTENKRIQVDNVDIITRVRSARFTTPQGNKIKRTATPSKSPEKRKTFTDSPSRRHMITTPTHSRFLSALVLKTPTSHHKYKNFHNRNSPSTPTDTSNGHVSNKTPPSRESREGYLINSIRAASCSPRKRSGHIKPRNLDIETHHDRLAIAPPPPIETPVGDELVPASIEDEMHGAMESCEGDDLSVNSIYEYEEDQSPKVNSPRALPYEEPQMDSDESSPASLTSFQKKRILSKHRTKNRLEKRRVANLDANRYIPDVFEIEYEPLKQPATYKSTTKWLEASKHHRHSLAKGSPGKDSDDGQYSSDEECLPPPVKLFGGGNMSDDDNSDSDRSDGVSAEGSRNTIKPFTPPVVSIFTPTTNESILDGTSCNSATPRSILRQSGSSRRHNGRVSKRKIRWEDDEPCKRIKTEVDGITVVKTEMDDDSQSSFLLTNGTLNKTADQSELDGPTFKNALGLENSMSNFQDVKALHQCQFLTTMCVELHCSSRNELLPDPAIDSISAIFVLISNDYPDNFRKSKECLHILLLDDKAEELASAEYYDGFSQTRSYSSEGNLIDAFIALVRLFDPDIFVGYEIEKSSFGYLIQRALYFGKDLTQELSRVLPIKREGDKGNPFRDKEEWNGTIGGRIVLNLWRLLRHEIAVQSYKFENAAYHILLRRVCKFPQKALNTYWSHKMHRHKVIQYYTVRVKGCIQIMEKLDLINRTSELARLFGIQFYEVLSRGSQFRVESMMLRATKPLDLIAPSPAVMQRAKMRAPEYLPLILEPRSNYYTDPVAVLDFQSLYPSMMIAYNYDYASLIGRVEHLGQTENFPIGCLEHAVSPADLLRLKDHIHVSPAGIAFVDKSIVKGVLPEMLEQILDTRQMVKRAMKKWKKEGASLHKVLDSRQLGLKLIANVTYGYTSANFSGRMPCVDIADSIVSKGRETLQRAIDYVKENQHRWGAEVVYGDTDSMFILFRGKSRDEAFKSAYQIAEEVTQANPKPVKLKFEKIYQPCILQSKKRYVGYAYETPEQVKPIYDAKGIETVRRDGCPAVRKILEKTLHVLFTSNKREKVESYVKSQFEKLFKGRVSMQDYIFAREFRGRQGYKPAACVPSLEIAKKLSAIDPRAEPLTSERVPYVVIYGNPTLPLIKLVRTPDEYLKNPSMRLNAHYYIEKVIIPALNRCLTLAGMNATKWYLQLPRKYLRNVLDSKPKGQGTLDDYVLHQNCLKCDGKAEDGLCNNCLSDEVHTVVYLQEVVRNAKSKLNSCIEICLNCAGETDRCVSIDCPVLHKLTRYQRDQPYIKKVEGELSKLESLEW